MFVKIIEHEVAIEKGSPRTICYDCRRYDILPGNKEEDFMLSIDVGEQNERVIEYPKEKHTVIIMNNEGKTVDVFRW